MTSYRRINSRTLNRSVSQQYNMVNFMKPISNAVYTNTQIVAGQLVNIEMLSNTDLGQSVVRDVSAGDIISLFSYSYTPKIANSYLVIEYQTIYFLNGSGADSIDAYIHVTDVSKNTISHTYQQWANGAGGGTRSGTIFPIVGRYTNTSVTAKSISVEIQNVTDADTVEVAGDISTWLKITEIAR